MTSRKLGVGESVYAKWPGSTLYYPGKVVAKDEDAGSVDVKFDFESSPVAIKAKFVYPEKTFKRSRSVSPARTPRGGTRKRSRSKSPSRTSRGRSRSPARTKPKPQKKPVQEIQQKQPTKEESPVKSVEVKENKEVAVSQTSSASSTFVREERTVVTTTRRVTRSVSKALQDDQEKETVTIDTSKCARYEFGEPYVVSLLILLLPVVLIGLRLICSDKKHCAVLKLPKVPPLNEFFNWKSALVVLGWFVVHEVLYLLPFGKVIRGRKLSDGTQLAYRANGFFTLILTLLTFGILTYLKQTQKAAKFVSSNFLSLTVSAICLSLLVSIFVFIKGVREKSGYSENGNTGCLPYDFFVGRQLNPRTYRFDWKHFALLRFGTISWVTINFLLLLKQYEESGKVFNQPTLLVVLFQLLYVADNLIFEESSIHSSGILKQGFGFMFAFGDFAFVPFFYTSQVWYLTKFSPQLKWYYILGILLLKGTGYYIYRRSRLEKDKFRENPREILKREVKIVYTSDGRHLLADGWWGRVRHPHYLGDILMAISWALACGFTHIFPWFYPIFLTVFLMDRAYRDELHCSNKYGLSWLEYKKRVPSSIFPNIFKMRH